MEIFRSDVSSVGNFERLSFIQDASVGLRAIIAIHDTRRGPAFGGVRRRAYTNEAEMLSDVCRLARAMTQKLALAGLAAGGAKTVVWDRPGIDLEGSYRALARVVDEMQGGYICGPDVGTGPREIEWMRVETAFVNDASNDASLRTAEGVFSGLDALRGSLGDQPAWSELTFVVQGLGGVGRDLVQRLQAEGATVVAGDIDGSTRAWAERHGVAWCGFDELWSQAGDVFVPCAVGGLLSHARAGQLRCRAVCGAANNILAAADVATELRSREIVFIPDELVNVGAVAEGVYARRWSGDRTRVEAELASLYSDIATRVRRACERQLRGFAAPHRG